MGLFSFISNAVKAVGHACKAVVSTVNTAVKKVKTFVQKTVKVVKNVVNKGVNTVSNGISWFNDKLTTTKNWFFKETWIGRGINTLTNAANKVINTISNGISWVTDKLTTAKNWFLEETWIGRGLNTCYDWVMNKTFIGKGIRWIGDQVTKVTNYFFEKTVVGCCLGKLKKWLDSTPIGKLINQLGPILTVASYCLGGVGGIIGKVINYSSKLYNTYNDFPGIILNKIVSNPFFQSLCKVKNDLIDKAKNYVINKFKSTSLYQKINPPIMKTINTVKKTIDITKKGINKFQSFIENNLPPLIVKGDQVVDFLKSKNPLICSGINVVKALGVSGLEKVMSIPIIKKSFAKVSETFNNYIAEPKKLTFTKMNELGEYYNNNLAKNVNTYLSKPINWINNNVVKPCAKAGFNFIKNKITSTDLYNNVKTTVNALNAGQKLIQVKPEILNLFKKEQKIPNVSSKPMVDSYIKKFTSHDGKQGVEKFLKTFEIINNPKEDSSQGRTTNCTEQKEKSINARITKKQISVMSINFNKNDRKYDEGNKQHSIDGNITLKNNTSETKSFKILDGQIFGCKTPNASQHTVVRGMKGELGPLEIKQFNLEAFCADSSLQWPRNKSDYELTQIRLKNFDSSTDQQETWRMT